MVDMAVIGAVSNSLNVALNISKAMLSIRDQSVIQEKIIELTSQIMSAQQSAMAAHAAQLDLLKEVRSLEKQIIEMETWETEKQRYELKVVGRGATTYALKPGMESGEDPHWLCTACYQNGKKFIIQAAGPAAQSGNEWRKVIWRCPTCSAEIRTPFATSPSNPSHPTEM